MLTSGATCKTQEKNQLIILWKSAGVSITDIQCYASLLSEDSESESKAISLPDNFSVALHESSSKVQQDFVKNSLSERAKNVEYGFVVVNQLEKATNGLAKNTITSLVKNHVQLHENVSTDAILEDTREGATPESSEKTKAGSSGKLDNSLEDWIVTTGQMPDCLDNLEVTVESVSKSANAGHLTLAKVLVKKSYAAGLLVRRIMLELGHPVVGSTAKYTKELNNSKGKGVYMTLCEIRIKNLINSSQPETTVCYEIPSKFFSLIDKEKKFFDIKVEKAQNELAQLSERDRSDQLDRSHSSYEGIDPVNELPYEYKINLKKFCDIEFVVTKDTLIPRKSTETLVYAALELLPQCGLECTGDTAINDISDTVKMGGKKILDLGTGNGCILLSILSKTSAMDTCGTGLEICNDALSVAAENVNKLGLAHRVQLEVGDFTRLHENEVLKTLGPFDIIVCNPPYLSKHKKNSFITGSIKHEPSISLYAEDGGYSCYKSIRDSLQKTFADSESSLLNTNGVLIFEVGKGMSNIVKSIYNDWDTVKMWEDYNGFTRCIAFRKNENRI
ncbi:Bifunctional methyltransferase [Zancudomyces culisetae]|uniref:Bifunctional methyltransferase n=1 Tax=Zancudomyces culisetae TaxID=1213189 RepID=A0A1R1PQ17_ZANCU|nr:Bifunctional methyltransferase [Zancudomyces culisetae]|eukprot:OMH83048.1 Bifunctional methyltransferase [Zancudomyces culisetae]